MNSTTVKGYVAPAYESVREAFAKNLASGLEGGASFAVYRNGEALVDLWGGHVDGKSSALVNDDTLFNIWSTSKGLAAICIAMLVDRGQLAYEEPVAKFWPEFAAEGKGRITVGELLSHQAGLVGVREKVTIEDFYEHERIASALASQRPYFETGLWGYHALTMGTLMDELVRRADGRTLSRFFAEEIAAKAGVEVFFGLPEEQDHRQAKTVIPPVAPVCLYDKPQQQAFEAAVLNPLFDLNWPNQRAWRASGHSSAGASANARGVAKLYDYLAHDGAIGTIRLLSPQVVREATKERVGGVDQSLGAYDRYAAGFRLNSGTMGASNDAFGHMGLGGSGGFADPTRKLGIAYTTNTLLTTHWHWVDPRLANLLVAFYSAHANDQ